MSSVFEKIKNVKVLLGQEQVNISGSGSYKTGDTLRWKTRRGNIRTGTVRGMSKSGDIQVKDDVTGGEYFIAPDQVQVPATARPAPQAKPKPKPQDKPGGIDAKTAERMQKRDLKSRERMHKREVKGAVKQAKYASKAGKPTMIQRLGNVAKTAGKIGAFAAGVPASYATPQNQQRRVSESSDINTSMDQQKLQERGDTLKFIKSVSEKNYSEADKYLKQIVDNKLVQKMSKFKDTEI